MTNTRKNFQSKRTKENFYKEAKKLNVRARSYFKLDEIDKKFKIIKENTKIIDLGCAPGGWLEYLDKNYKSLTLIGIDLLEVKKQHEYTKKVTIIQDDFNNINQYNFGTFDTIISDIAPEFSGDSTYDRGRTHKLNYLVIDFAQKNLKLGGDLIFKTFQGEDLYYVLKKAKEIFEKVTTFKPKSSQRESAETFVICQNKTQNNTNN